MMLDEFPALGRLDFFEAELAFMAGYGIRAFLIAQSLNQISKAYGENNAILDNCHVRIAFSSNDERTAKRISDALGTATELRAQRNYAGHRLSPWLSHVMVSRQETARPLLTPGEVMQLPPKDELVLVSGMAPIRAKKLRYYEDHNFTTRVLPAPELADGPYRDRPAIRSDDWSGQVHSTDARLESDPEAMQVDASTSNGGLQCQRTPDDAKPVRRRARTAQQQVEFTFAEPADDEPANEELDRTVRRAHAMNNGDAHKRGRDDLMPSF
jgi:type IV secretion system protein VirD4